MIELHRPVKSAFADEIEEQFRHMVLAHKVIVETPEDAEHTLPYIKEGSIIAKTEAGIRFHLRVLAQEVEAHYQFSGDSCIIGPDGKMC